MSAKMYLIARPPNEGARRLAWWIGETALPTLRFLRGRSDVVRLTMARIAGACHAELSIVDRLLSGEIEPGADMAFAISQATGGAVVSRDWRMPPAGGWGERPAVRDYRPAARVMRVAA